MTFKNTFGQKLKNLKDNAKRSLENAVDIARMTTSIAVPLAIVAVAGTIAVNALVYTVMAGTEGVEKACGISATNYTARLKEKHTTLGSNGESHNYGVFELKDGRTITAFDTPVVTEGTFFPYNFDKLQTNKTYDVRTFGWIVPSIVDSKEIK